MSAPPLEQPSPPRKPRIAQVRLRSAAIDSLVENYLAGASANSVARKYGIDPQTALNHLRRRNVPVRPRPIGIPDAELAQAQALRDAGWTLKAIGERCGCTTTGVSKALKRYAKRQS